MGFLKSKLHSFRSMLDRRHNVRAHFWQTLANYTQQAFGLGFGILLARILRPEDYGTFAIAGATLSIFLLPTNWTLAPQVLSHGASNPALIGQAFAFAYKLIIPKLALSIAASCYIGFNYGASSAVLTLVLALPMIFSDLISILRASLESRNDFKAGFIDSILSSLIAVGLGLPLAWMGAGVWALAAPTIPYFLVQLYFFRRRSGHTLKPIHDTEANSSWKIGLWLWLSSACDQGLHRLDKVILGNFSSVSDVGNYNRAFNYAPLSTRFLNSFVSNPTVVALAKSRNSKDRTRILVRCGIPLSAGGLINFIIWWFFSAPIVSFVFGPNWLEAIPVFQAMAPMGFLGAFAYLPIAFLLADRSYKILALIRTGTIVLFVAAAFLVSHRMNAVLMAVSFQAVLLIQGCFFWFICIQRLRQSSDT